METLLATFSAAWLAFDVKFSHEAFGGYAPVASVMANRVYNVAEDEMRKFLAGISPNFWMESATEYKGRTFQIGNRSLYGAAYEAEILRLASILKANGFKVRVMAGTSDRRSALYLTLDPKIGEKAIAIHAAYLKLLSENGAHLPDWAADVAKAA